MSGRKEKILEPFVREKDYMDYRVAEGIEKNRKDFATIRIVDREGRPVTHAQVEVRQLSHQFKFGANLFLLDEMETDAKNAAYREVFPQVFNHATLPFYWNGLEPVRGKPRFEKGSPKVYRRPAPDLCLDFCEANGIRPKAHCLIYDAWAPDWLPDDVPESKRLYRERLRQLADRYRGRIEDWEVINETLIPYQKKNRSLFIEPDYLEWAFRSAREFFPDNRLLLNEATENIWGKGFNYCRGAYYLLIERLMNLRVPMDGIGMQFHMFYPRGEEEERSPLFYDPRRLYATLDCYGRFRKPVQITEITIPAYSEEKEDEETQAEIVKNLYQIWFSHEAVESIVWWNLVDGYAYVREGDNWNENSYYGGLLRHDMSFKPAWYAVRDLVKNKWHTEASLSAGDADRVTFRGFYGDYEVAVTHEGKRAVSRIRLSNRDDIREYTVTI